MEIRLVIGVDLDETTIGVEVNSLEGVVGFVYLDTFHENLVIFTDVVDDHGRFNLDSDETDDFFVLTVVVVGRVGDVEVHDFVVGVDDTFITDDSDGVVHDIRHFTTQIVRVVDEIGIGVFLGQDGVTLVIHFVGVFGSDVTQVGFLGG